MGKLAGVKPLAIVRYCYAVLAITALHLDAYAGGEGMFADIGERLLNDARQLHHRSGRQVNERLILHDQLDIQPVQAMIPVQMCAAGAAMSAAVGERPLTDARQLDHRSGRQVNERLILPDQLDVQPAQAMIPVQMCAYGSKKPPRRGGTLAQAEDRVAGVVVRLG